MEEMLSLLEQEEWRIIDQSSLGPMFHPIQSFAMDDTLCEAIGTGQSPAVARTWVHYDSVILGIQDVRLPHLQDGIQWLGQQGYDYIVRTSGGLAVLVDEGVLNITLIFPENEKGIDINRGYEAMYQFVQMMFADLTNKIEAREIHGSYCPGSYDLSIDGKKFAGISQRRVKKGVAVQIYLCVSGSGSKRAEIIREFYQRALQKEPTKFEYPKVRPEVMASLSELTGVELTIQQSMLRFLQVLQKVSNGKFYNSELTTEELQMYQHYYARVLERNEKWLP
ncbi:lipoate--protein ligase family protein [Caldibacillus lycopersici]|uniref:Octanoyl-[GcvH]:protein N-octanoyltransferase n=1 Tax=Perspicuibacillus lycopersici TaxID=1325689 RepID=A0AAE3LMW2_9BACI|nr:lipoate--protein ligase family protein [Perspicuibacillus lycopersici]MCU9613346.1 lipoate--protein ligase family protein [Perspicuibacillus lycopersici]